MRVAVVDIGTNSTRLLVADVEAGALTEVERDSVVTRLGDGVDATGRLREDAQARVFAVLDRYAAVIDRLGAEVSTAVLTSAVRDAANGAAFAAAARDRHGFDARTLSGAEEAAATFRGATAARPAPPGAATFRGATAAGDRGDGAPVLVIDIGGGSTELVTGAGRAPAFHVSTQIGVVRHTERHLRGDPPTQGELDALAAAVRAELGAAVPLAVRTGVGAAIAVAGTPTSCAAMELELEPYDPARVEGHVLGRERLGALLARVAALPLAERRRVPGLHPDRAPTIVAGIVVLAEALDAFGLDAVEVSERDILWGVALATAERRLAQA